MRDSISSKWLLRWHEVQTGAVDNKFFFVNSWDALLVGLYEADCNFVGVAMRTPASSCEEEDWPSYVSLIRFNSDVTQKTFFSYCRRKVELLFLFM